MNKLIVCALAIAMVLTPIAPVLAQEAEPAPAVEAPAQEPVLSEPKVAEPEESKKSNQEEKNIKTDKTEKDKDGKKDGEGVPEEPDATLRSISSVSGSGTKQNSTINLSLPSADSTQGSMEYRYPIAVPPGRNGLQPDLPLTYNSANTDTSSPFGYDWSVNIPYIERINKTGTNNLYS